MRSFLSFGDIFPGTAGIIELIRLGLMLCFMWLPFRKTDATWDKTADGRRSLRFLRFTLLKLCGEWCIELQLEVGVTLRDVFSSSSSKAFPSTPEDEDGSAAIFKDLTGEEDGGERRL